MLKKTIKYTDYEGQKQTEDHWFNLSKAEVIELEAETTGGLEAELKRIIAQSDSKELVAIVKNLICRSYGEKYSDGKRTFFIKKRDGQMLVDLFMQSDAYSELFIELLTSEDALANFIKGIVPDVPDIPAKTDNPADAPAELTLVE